MAGTTTPAKRASVSPVATIHDPDERERAGRVANAVTQILLDAGSAEADRVLEATDAPEQTLDPALWGPAPRREDIATARMANLRKQFVARRALEEASVSRAEAAELLGTSDQAITTALEARRLLGFKRGRRWMIPAWQFDADAERGVLPGLNALADAFPGGVIALSAWATRPSPDLAGRPPRDVLARGRVESVVRVARTLTAAGW